MDTQNFVAAWKTGIFSKADPQKVADEIESIGDSATPRQILDLAKKPDTELHKIIDWDDKIASEKWRLHQVRNIVRELVFVKPESSSDSAPIRIFYKTDSETKGYQPTRKLVRNQDEYQSLLNKALMELRAFKMRYSCIKELQEIFDMID